jgi:hypothetical protein
VVLDESPLYIGWRVLRERTSTVTRGLHTEQAGSGEEGARAACMARSTQWSHITGLGRAQSHAVELDPGKGRRNSALMWVAPRLALKKACGRARDPRGPVGAAVARSRVTQLLSRTFKSALAICWASHECNMRCGAGLR